MATLEKIRSKSVLLLIVIGVALLAFIVGDAITNSRNLFGDHTTVAKIGSSKIGFQEYQNKREELNNRLEEARKQNPEQFANFDAQVLSQMALDQLIQEEILLSAANKAGIKTSGNLLRYYMIENPQSQEVMDLVRQLNQSGLSVQTPQQAYEIIFNPKRNGLTDAQMAPFQRSWIALENRMKEQLKGMIYQRVLSGTVKANDLDKRALYNDYVTTTSVNVAFLPFGALDPKAYPVTAVEIKEAYNKKKNMYKVEEETKDVSFIAVTIAPSASDLKTSQALEAKTRAQLSDSAGQASKALKKEGVMLTRNSFRASDIPAGEVKDFVTSAAKGQVKTIYNNLQGFNIIRMGNRTETVDSIKINVVSVASQKLGDKVLAALNGGLNVDSVSKRFPADSVMAQPSQWVPLFSAQGPTNAIEESMLDSLKHAGGKYIALQSSPQGMVLAKIVEQKAPVAVYNYDEATYVLGPSSKTINDERAKLEKFLAANTTAEDFNKNAEKAGFTLQKYSFTQSTPAVPRMMGMNAYFPESRQVVRWVMIDGKPGKVSHIYENKNAVSPALYVAAVNNSYDEYVPVENEDLNALLTREVRASKAGDKLVSQYSKNTQSLGAAAKAMGTSVREYPTFRFAQGAGIGDAKLIGRINGTKADKKVVISKGTDGVYVYQIINKGKENFPFNNDVYQQQYFQLVNPNLMEMIKGDKKIKNTIYKFEAGE